MVVHDALLAILNFVGETLKDVRSITLNYNIEHSCRQQTRLRSEFRGQKRARKETHGNKSRQLLIICHKISRRIIITKIRME